MTRPDVPGDISRLAWAKEKLRGGTEVRITGGGAKLTSVDCHVLLDALTAADVLSSEDTRALLRDVIGACAPPVEALCGVHADRKWIAPDTMDALDKARDSLRTAAAALARLDLRENQ